MRSWSHRFPQARWPLLVAHRGASALAPENSAASFEAAVRVGADAIETDVRLTADGVPVCFHDADLRRLAGDGRRVQDVRLTELWDLVPQVPTLSEALRITGRMCLLLDVKVALEAEVEMIVDAVLAADAIGRTLLGLRNPALAMAVAERSRRPDILAFAPDPDSVASWKQAGASWFRLWQADLTQARAESVRNAGLGLAVMTGDYRGRGHPVGYLAEDGIVALLACAPDAVLLDDPAVLTEWAACHRPVASSR